MKQKQIRLVTDQVNQQEMAVLLSELSRVLDNAVDGDVVELGCYEGGSAVAIQQLLTDSDSSDKTLWLYDSFEGLPEKTSEDNSVNGELFVGGALKASKARLERNFHKANLYLPEIKKAWFFELDTDDLPDKICFAFLDGDFYESIMDSFKLVFPKVSKGGVIVVDDYENTKLPGVKKAVDEFALLQNLTVKSDISLAIIKI
ncbi:MAG: TylF/MycF/NovP-related O-methyltransferase [Candidatus Saccharibacteria bacterium]|nr:TylF/MycF/NovP-related O-methyltransferase [Candidatus Saccharibacteria bacterium]